MDRWHQPAVALWPQIQQAAKVFTWLHRLELYNLIRHAALRRPSPYTVAQAKALLAQFKRDVYQGVLEYADFSVQEVLQEFTSWSAAHGFQHIVTTLDLLHVCAATVLGADQFITTDDRQHEAAKLAGLTAILVR
jgi:predicted nucleic acid-binding protein